jgi:hypothetical protein
MSFHRDGEGLGTSIASLSRAMSSVCPLSGRQSRNPYECLFRDITSIIGLDGAATNP